MRALVADDDRVNTTLVARALEKWGLQVVAAEDGHDAWELLDPVHGIDLASGFPPPEQILDFRAP